MEVTSIVPIGFERAIQISRTSRRDKPARLLLKNGKLGEIKNFMNRQSINNIDFCDLMIRE